MGTDVLLKDRRKEKSENKGIKFEIPEVEWKEFGSDKTIL